MAPGARLPLAPGPPARPRPAKHTPPRPRTERQPTRPACTWPTGTGPTRARRPAPGPRTETGSANGRANWLQKGRGVVGAPGAGLYLVGCRRRRNGLAAGWKRTGTRLSLACIRGVELQRPARTSAVARVTRPSASVLALLSPASHASLKRASLSRASRSRASLLRARAHGPSRRPGGRLPHRHRQRAGRRKSAADAAAQAAAQTPVVVVLRAARMFDGTGAAPITNAVVVVTDDKITAAGPASSVTVPAGARVVDLGQATLLPGF